MKILIIVLIYIFAVFLILFFNYCANTRQNEKKD